MTTQLQHPEARRRVTAARTTLVMDEPFFGMLAPRLKLVEEPNCACPDLKDCPHTAWTDGQSLGYWPRYVMSLTMKRLEGLICHEVMHCALGHPWRRDGREIGKANEAMDRAINPILRDAGFELPPDGLYELEPSHHGKSWEWIFDRLPVPDQQKNDKRQGSGGGSGNGSGSSQTDPQQGPNDKGKPGQGPAGPSQDEGGNDPGGQGRNRAGNDPAGPQDAQGPETQGNTPPNSRSSSTGQMRENEGPDKDHKSDVKTRAARPTDSLGEVRDAPLESADPDEAPPSESDWQQAVQQAAVLAKGQGKLPASLRRFAKKAVAPRYDWRSVTMRFAQEVARSDYSFARPNPRYIAGRVYMPALRNHEVGVIGVGVDVSGSVDDVLLGKFAGILNDIMDEVKPRQIKVLYCDAQVANEEAFEKGEEVVLNACGGGGTDFRPVFDAIEDWEEPPVCVIYLTDLMGTFPETDPGIPTLWVTGETRPRSAPFGEVIAAEL